MQEAALQAWDYASSEFKHTLVLVTHSTDPQQQSNTPVWRTQMWNWDGLGEHPYHRLTLHLGRYEAKKTLCVWRSTNIGEQPANLFL